MSNDKEITGRLSSLAINTSRVPKPVKAKDTRGPPKLQIPSNPKWNSLSEIGQNDIVVTPCSFQPETIDCHDSKNTTIIYY